MNKCWCHTNCNVDYCENYFVCGNCKTLVSKHNFDKDIYDVHDNEDELYGKEYWEKHMCEMTNKNSLSEIIDMYMQERVPHWLNIIYKYVLPYSNKNIAEIGCGIGALSFALKNNGYNQVAFDLSPHICEYVKNTLDVNVVKGEFKYEHDKYDAIIGVDFIEHLIEPDEFISEASKAIKDTGFLILQTPTYDTSKSYEDYKTDLPQFLNFFVPMEHTYVFNRYALEIMLRDSGFKYISYEPTLLGDEYDSFMFASKQPIKTVSENELKNVLNRNPQSRTMSALMNSYYDICKLKKVKDEIETEANKRTEGLHELTHIINGLKLENLSQQEIINNLTKNIEIIEADRAARLDLINKLSDEITELKK